MKKAKENWIGKQCSEFEENLTENNSNRERLDHCEKKEKLLPSKIIQANASQTNERY